MSVLSATIWVKAKHVDVMHEIYISSEASFGQSLQACVSILDYDIWLAYLEEVCLWESLIIHLKGFGESLFNLF